MNEPAQTDAALDGAGLDRRAFVGLAAGLTSAGLLSAGLLGAGARSARGQAVEPRTAPARGVARNLIFLVSDGMSAGTLHLADLALRRRNGRASAWVSLLEDREFRRGVMDTAAADSLVTDSAAASTAWGIGHRVNNGAIGLTVDGAMPTPILVHARQAGKATGLVTTTRLTHATPAGFVANLQTGRDDEAAIAQQILERGVDVMLGGGRRLLQPGTARAAGVANVVETRSALGAVAPGAPGRLLGVFADEHMAFSLDRPDEQPTLEEMTRAALARLALAPDGFVVQIEGGRVDHAAHANDAPSLVADQIAFDEALGAALEFARARADTLVIVCTDHGNANPGLTEYGPKGELGLQTLLGARRSFEALVPAIQALGAQASRDAVREAVRSATGVSLEAPELDVLARWRAGEAVDPFLIAGKGTAPLGSVLANHYRVAFLSINHTADYAEVGALGPGSGRLPPVLSNRELHGVMVGALDLPPARPV